MSAYIIEAAALQSRMGVICDELAITHLADGKLQIEFRQGDVKIASLISPAPINKGESLTLQKLQCIVDFQVLPA